MMVGRRLGVLAIVVSGTFSARADTTNETLNKTGVAGAPLYIGHFAGANPDCTSMGRTFVRVSRSPTHGVVNTREGFGFSNFLRLPTCNSRKVKGVTVWYRPETGFTGYDAMEIDVIYPSGNERLNYYNITIK